MDTESGYKVELKEFQGPLELLLDLIEKRKLSINEVALAQVADDFVAYVNRLGQFPLAESAHFILTASTLLLIKSRSLLPDLALTVEEEESVHDLEKRILLYKKIRDLSIHVKEKFGANIIFSKNNYTQIQPVFSPDAGMTIPAILSSIRDVLKNIPKKENIPRAVIKKVISLEEMIEDLTKRVTKSLSTSFREFTKVGSKEKVHVIVGFLAMLELVKQGIIMVSQEKGFDDISIETAKVSVPRY
jgi:segregation and condensation protein A